MANVTPQKTVKAMVQTGLNSSLIAPNRRILSFQFMLLPNVLQAQMEIHLRGRNKGITPTYSLPSHVEQRDPDCLQQIIQLLFSSNSLDSQKN